MWLGDGVVINDRDARGHHNGDVQVRLDSTGLELAVAEALAQLLRAPRLRILTLTGNKLNEARAHIDSTQRPDSSSASSPPHGPRTVNKLHMIHTDYCSC